MTGEIFEVLAEHSVLRHSLGGERTGPASDEGFGEGLDAGLDAPQLLTAFAFRTRAASLLSGKGPDWCSGYLSGLLIGAEIAGHRDWLGAATVPLIGSERLCSLYAKALAKLGVASTVIEASTATIAGLKAARAQ